MKESSLPIIPKGSEDAAKTKEVEEKTHKDEVSSVEAFQLMDKRDEEHIIASLEGRFIDEYVYEYTDRRGNVIRGLSITGVNEAAKDYGGIQCAVDKIKMIDNEEEIQMIVEAMDTKTKTAALGASTQPKKMKTYNGFVKDPFCLQKCLSKAQRNAKRQLLSHELIKKWIEKKKGTAVKVVDGSQTDKKKKEVKKPAQSNKYVELLGTCKEAKKKIGATEYYAVLKTLGHKHASDIKDVKDLDGFILKCREAYKSNK